MPVLAKANKPVIDNPASERGRLAADRPGEFHFDSTLDYISFVAGAVRQSKMKYTNISKGGGMSATTVSNLASGKTHYPRFGTITGILGALGYETVIRGGRK